uniref:Uncharacterized protein n=1 Tax=Anopheles albimanus TaxID=7167 RepID=A0A182FBE9_ANOAL
METNTMQVEEERKKAREATKLRIKSPEQQRKVAAGFFTSDHESRVEDTDTTRELGPSQPNDETYEMPWPVDDASIEGFLPSCMVVLSVPDESCLDTTGDRPPAPPALGDDFGEYCSTFRNWSGVIALP